MTNSEAIETLQANYPDPCYGLLRDAVDIAICALSAQPETHEKRTETHACDLIDKQPTIEPQPEPEEYEWCTDCKEYDQDKHCCHRWNKVIRDTVEDLKQAQPDWIPCIETVEIPDHEVLACDKRGEEIIGYLEYADDQWICASEDLVMYDPIAWMEKPKPYKGGQE